MSALNDYRLLWNAALTQRSPGRLFGLLKFLLMILVLIGVGAAALLHNVLLGVRFVVGIPVVLLLLLCVIHLVPGFVLMNTPANAQLVPRMRKRMVEMTVAIWVLAGAASLMIPIWQAAPVVALWVISMSASRAGSKFATVLVMLSAMSGVIVADMPVPVRAFFMSVPGFFCACAAVVAFGAWAIRTTLPSAGDSHFGHRKQQTETIERLESMGRKHADLAPKRATSLYGFALREAIRSGQPRRLMLHALGPSATVTLILPAWILFVALCIGVYLLLQWVGTPGKDGSLSLLGWILFVTITLALQLGTTAVWRTLMKGSREEQGLLRLAACSPAAGEWNRNLGAALAWQVALNMVFATGAAIVLGLATGLDRDGIVWVAALVSALFMPSIAFVLLDYSREQHPWPLPRTLFALGVAVMLVALHVGLQFKIGVASWVLLAAYSNAIGAVVAALRWKRMLAAPVAFPAGRFA